MSKVVFFRADDGIHGDELWITDGTDAGTRMVKDIFPDDPSPGGWVGLGSYPSGMTSIGGGRVILSASGEFGDSEVWISDGTEAGTTLLKDLNSSRSSSPREFTSLGDGRVVFQADGPSGSGLGVWVSDGTPDGTFQLQGDGQGDINPHEFATLGNGRALFFADDGVHGREIWVTDGTEEGTQLLLDYQPGSEGSFLSINPLGNGTAFLRPSFSGDEIWLTDGTPAGTTIFEVEADYFAPVMDMPFDNVLLSANRDNKTHYLVSDGTLEGTYGHGEPVTPPVNPAQFVPFELGVGEGLYPASTYVASNRQVILDDGRLMFSMDTREKVVSVRSNGDTYIETLRYGDQLWVTDGTQAGTHMLERINQGPPLYYDIPSSRVDDFFLLPNGDVAIVAWNGETSNLYVANASDLSVNTLATNVEDAFRHKPLGNGYVFFEINGDQEGLWVTDGSAANTKLLIAGLSAFAGINDSLKIDGDQWLIEVNIRPDPNSYATQPEVWLIDAETISAQKVLNGPMPFATDGLNTKLTSFGNGTYLAVVATDAGESNPWVLDVNAGTFSLLTDETLDTGSRHNVYPVAITPADQIPIPVSTLFDEKISLEETATAPFDLDTYFTNPGGGDLSYNVADAPGAVTLNPETNEVSADQSIEPGTYTVQVTARNDDGGSVTDTFDWTVVDTGTLAIAATGDWARESATGPIVSAQGSVLTIGRKDGQMALFRVEPKDATTPVAKIENGKITLEGQVFSTQVSTDTPLMQGTMTIDMKTMEVSSFADETLTTDYRLVEGLIDPQFKTVSIETDKLVFQTDLVFDDTAGGSGPSYASLSTKNAPLTLSVGAEGLGFGVTGGVERWSPDPIEFDLGGGSTLSIGFSDLGIDYDAATDATYLMGKATVGWGGAIDNGFDFLDNNSEQSLVIDLAGTASQGNYFQRGDKYLKIIKGSTGWDWDIIGEIKYADKYDGPAPSNGLLVKELAVGFDTVQDAYSGSFKANIPLFFGLDLSAALAFASNPDLALNKIEVGVDGIDAPIGTTGIFVQGGTLGLENLAGADPKAGWTYKAEITGTFGPDNDLVSSPLHGKVTGTIQELIESQKTGYKLTGSVAVDSKVGYFIPDIVNAFATPLIKYFGVEPDAVTGFELLNATSTTALDFLSDTVQLDATISLLNGVVKGTAQLIDKPLGGSDVRQISGSVKADLTIPYDFPVIGGLSRSGAALVTYSSDGDFSNDIASFWSQFTIDLGLTTLNSAFGAEMKFNGDWRFLGRKDIPKTSSWDLDGDDDLVILTARWEIGSDDAALQLVLPDGTILDEAAIAARDDMALVTDLNTDRSRHVALENPEVGTWDLQLTDPSGLGDVVYEASEMLESAHADIINITPNVQAHKADLSIDLDIGDAEMATVVVFAADTEDEVTGIELARLTLEGDATAVDVTLDYDDLGPGDWYISARTDADGLVPVVSQFASPLSISGAADLGLSVQQDAHAPTGQHILTIEVENKGDRHSETGTLTIDIPDHMTGAVPLEDFDAGALEDSESLLDLPSLAPGETFQTRIALPVGAEQSAEPIFLSVQTEGHDADLRDNSLAYVLLSQTNSIATGSIAITGAAFEGSTLTADISGIVEPDIILTDTISYQWRRDGVDIPGPGDEAQSYLVTAADVGTDLTVEVTFFDAGGTEETLISAAVVPTIPGRLIEGTTNPDALQGGDGGDTILGFAADDILTGGMGDDDLQGGDGHDTAVFDGPQSRFVLTLSPDEITITDRSPTGLGTDHLTSIELLDFGTEIDLFGGNPMNLDIFDGPATLTAPQFAEIIELYIAYFNRAPDALGLFYWATEFTNGFTVPMMAANFFFQPEAQATYASVLDDRGKLDTTDQSKVEDFVTEVYGNVLGRTPDGPGFEYWVGELLNNPNITPPIFILSIIGGAKFPGNPTPQTDMDQAYLTTKSDLGAYFSVIKGMSDIADASASMALFDGSDTSRDATLAAIDAHFADALDPDTGDFLMPLVGVIDDPFAVL